MTFAEKDEDKDEDKDKDKDEDEHEDEDKDEDKDKDKDKSQYHLAIFQGHLHFRLDVLALLVNRPVQLDVHL